MTGGPQQADADAVVVVLAWLRAQPATATLLGGPTGEHVSGIPKAPWPQLVVSDGSAGDLGDMTWRAEHEVTFELHGNPDGSPGKAAMKNMMMRVYRIVADLADSEQNDPYQPVVSRVRPSGVAVYTPLSSGQPVYYGGVLVTIRPPRLLAP